MFPAAPGIQVFSALRSGYHSATVGPDGAPPAAGPLELRVPRLFLKWGLPSTFSSQAPCLGTGEPSDLGWAGLGPACVDFGSRVGFPEQIRGTGRVARRQLNLPRGRGSRGVLVPERHPDPEQAKPWHLHLPTKAGS